MAPKKRGMPWWAWTLIALGVAAVLGVVALTVFGFVAYVTHSVAETSPDQPFLEGPAQQPDADAPLACPDRCFDIGSAALLEVSAGDVALLSIEDELYGVGDLESATVAQVASDGGDQWLSIGGDAECSFVPTNAPYFPVGSDSTSDDPISWVQVWQTGDEVMDIAGREFATTDDASAFMHDLHTRVAACPWQDLDVPSAGGLDTSLIQITAQAAVDVPTDVAAVGWVREGTPGPRWRSYVWDLQRGNLVVQVRVFTDGRVLEKDVATFVERVAVRLGQLQPPA
ncbi:hypothetical protein [Protaetiibacter mangrovi]|uniref:DUF3558 domain-containing protein n=1 Tax=Protaetiibacter mangrovi TaxID=2970926 RepID=A0ABT1ZE34_9MICO|nr:hypothetical protein [Protaetiibacter mangrovi]MCS0498962.1 hypothetical protein [Protaetiibacter mangrovi]